MKKKLSLTILLGCLTVLTPGRLQAAEASAADLLLQLHQAVLDGDQKRVSELIEEGVDALRPPHFKSSLLISAIENRVPGIAKALINASADVNTPFISFTPLMLASKNGMKEIVELLLEKGADPFLINFQGKTALDLAPNDEIKKTIQDAIEARKKRRKEITQALQESVEYLPEDIADIIAFQVTGIELPKRKRVKPQQLTEEEEQWILSGVESFAEWKKLQQDKQ